MKLNNKGWGYRQMLLMTSILLIFLLFTAYNIYALYKNLDHSDAKVYMNLESKLQVAAASYIKDEGMRNQSVILTLTELKDLGYITEFNDDEGKACNGYLIYQNYDYNAYIKCPNYISTNYSSFHE